MMISTQTLWQFPITAIDSDVARDLAGICEAEPQTNRTIRTLPLLNAFLDVTGQRVSRKDICELDHIEAILFGYEGFLFKHTDYPARLVGMFYNSARRILLNLAGLEKENIQTGNKNAWKVRQTESKLYFAQLFTDEVKLKYYQGWFAVSRDGEKFFLDLARFHNQFGEKLTSYVLDHINNYTSKYAAGSVKQHVKILKPAFHLMCKLYRTKKELTVLQDSLQVNAFAEMLFAERKANCIINGNELKYFYLEWGITTTTLKNTLIGTAIMAEPSYPIFCPTYTSAEGSKPEQSLYDKALTPIPLTITDEAAFTLFRKTIDGDLSLVAECCEMTCQQEMEKLEQRATLSEGGRIIHNFDRKKLDIHFTLRDIYATWNEYTYRIHETGIFDSIPAAELIEIIQPLGAYTLYPYLLLMVKEKAVITPSWFKEFELYDKHNQMTGFTQSGDNWIVTSFKPRSKPRARQSIKCNEKLTKLMHDIIALTKEAREYLRSIGDPSWRYLLLSGGGGFSKPIRITKLDKYNVRTLKTVPFYRNLRSLENIAKEKITSIITNLSLRSVRASRVIQIYLETFSEEAVARELRHSDNSRGLMEKYLPRAIREFIMERWLRLFQNAIIFEAMKDSPYLLEALDFNTQEELDEFLLNHKPHYRIRPQAEADFSDTSLIDENAKIPGTYDRAYIALNEQKLVVLLSLYLVITEAMNSQSKITLGALRWYPIAKLLTQAAVVQREGSLSGFCSYSVQELLRHAEPDILLAKKLEGLVYE
jgi:hypothetical protein